MLKKEQTGSIEDKVYNWPTKNVEGFTTKEIKALVREYPDIKMRAFNKAFGTNTCMMKDGEFVFYHRDVLTALRMCIEKRGMYQHEFD